MGKLKPGQLSALGMGIIAKVEEVEAKGQGGSFLNFVVGMTWWLVMSWAAAWEKCSIKILIL